MAPRSEHCYTEWSCESAIMSPSAHPPSVARQRRACTMSRGREMRTILDLQVLAISYYCVGSRHYYVASSAPKTSRCAVC